MCEERLRLLEAQISVLERQVKFLLRVNGIDLSALREVSDEELLNHYRDVVRLLSLRRKYYPPKIIDRWAQFFCQLSEFEVVRLQNIVDYEHTWEPFYHLCVKMMTSIRQHPHFAADLDLRQLYGLLERSRKNLREIALLMVKKYPETLSPKVKALLKEGKLSPPPYSAKPGI